MADIIHYTSFLHQKLISAGPLPAHSWLAIKEELQSVHCVAGSPLPHKYGHAYFVGNGLLKECDHDSGKGNEVIRFEAEGHIFFTPSGTKSRQLFALEPTTLLYLDQSAIQRLHQVHPHLVSLFKTLRDEWYRSLYFRYSLLYLPYTERVVKFRQRYPALVSRIGPQDLASYLAMPTSAATFPR